MLNYTSVGGSSIAVDLSPLNGSVPTAVQYAWGVVRVLGVVILSRNLCYET